MPLWCPFSFPYSFYKLLVTQLVRLTFSVISRSCNGAHAVLGGHFSRGGGLAVVAVDSEEIAPSAPLRRGAISARAAPCLPCAKLTAAPRSGPAGIRQFHRWGVDTPLDIFVALCVLEPINSVEFFLADHSIGIHRWLL